MIAHEPSFMGKQHEGAAAFTVNSRSPDYYSNSLHYSCGLRGKMHFLSANVPLFGGGENERVSNFVKVLVANRLCGWDAP
ncbi:hypothetical protein GGD66_002175 [Bradyrhizobium sp. CIR48]|nr:hypothetical protein [Bradyrhizobium sp. CIR48]